MLGLILNNADFLFVRAKTLFSEERVLSCYCNGGRKVLRVRVDNGLSNIHHGTKSYTRITHFSELTVIGDLYIFCEQVDLGNPDISQVKVAVLFSMKAYLRTNISTLDSRQGVEFFILDRNKEWIYSMVFPFDDGLGKNNGMTGKK